MLRECDQSKLITINRMAKFKENGKLKLLIIVGTRPEIMANELKMPHLVVSGIYMGLQAVCCLWYIVYPGYLTFFLQLALLVSAYLMFEKKYYHLHANNS